MARITVSINDGIVREFRETVKKNLGQGKGIFGKAIEEAIKKWIEKEA